MLILPVSPSPLSLLLHRMARVNSGSDATTDLLIWAV